MKKQSFIHWLLAAAIVEFVGAGPAGAQLPGASAAAGMNPALTRLFGNIKGFTAKAEVEVIEASGKRVAATPMDFTYLNKKWRLDVDLEKVSSTSQPPAMIATLKKMNMSQITTVIRPDKQTVYVFWPGQKVTLATPLAPDDATAAETDVKLTTTAVGKETVDGHPCTKNKVTITDGKGQVTEAITWNAADLKEFPVQIETKERDNTSRVHFKQVSLTEPAASRFESPADYRQFSNQQELLQDIMKRLASAETNK